jgi:hypothetical protein
MIETIKNKKHMNANPQSSTSKDRPKKQTLTIVVSSTPTEVTRNENAPLGSVIEKALEQTKNLGQPPENWELKDKPGNILDLNKKIGDYHFPEDVVLFLSLKAGIGG